MRSNTRNIWWQLGVGVVAVSLLSIGFFLAKAAKFKERVRLNAETRATLESAKQTWAGHKFQPFDDSIDVRSLTDQGDRLYAVASGSSGLSSLQKEDAIESIRKFFNAYSTRDYRQYIAFRIPSPNYTVSDDCVRWMRTALRNHGVQVDAGVPEDVFQKYWEQDLFGCQSYISGIAGDTIRVTFTQEVSRINVRDCEYFPSGVPVVGFQAYEPFFIYRDQPAFSKELTSTPGLSMIITCVARIRSPDYPLPLLYRAYWSDEESKWIPLGIGVGSIYGRTRAPLL